MIRKQILNTELEKTKVDDPWNSQLCPIWYPNVKRLLKS